MRASPFPFRRFPMAARIGIFAKPPIPGQTKSRLAMDVGEDAAAALSAAMLRDLLDEMHAVHGARPDVQLEVWQPPGTKPDAYPPGILAGCELRSQQGKDLGARLIHAFGDPGPTVIIGSDCITISATLLGQALDALRLHQAVFQPADDGGYTLVGLSRPCRGLFSAIDWGSEQVWRQTRDRLETTGCPYTLLPASFDIDTSQDLERLREFVRSHRRHHTQAWLERFATP